MNKDMPLFEQAAATPAPRPKQAYQRPGVPVLPQAALDGCEIQQLEGVGKYAGRKAGQLWLPQEHIPAGLGNGGPLVVQGRECEAFVVLRDMWPGQPLREGKYGLLRWWWP